ncbi:MAG: hypothetical protein Q4F02_01600 [Candidatus Saccharibacteria bacterium]|nr:hypothetical protein [Candidatus Saccharibacteria bacterium]
MATKTTPETTEQAAPAPVQASPQPQVQYVMMEKSLKGVGGWLIFWMILFSFAAISYISAFFAAMLNLSSAASIIMLIFAPLLAIGYVASVVTMAMEKRIGKLLTWVTLGVSAVHSVIVLIVSYVTSYSSYSRYDYGYSYSRTSDKELPMLIAMILISLLVHGLIALYFILSRRIKETLVK